MSKKNTFFGESLFKNNITYLNYFYRLIDLAVSRFIYKNLPMTVDQRYMEISLLYDGCAVYFNDDIIGNLCLSISPTSNYNIYGVPSDRRAYSRYNNYTMDLDESNSVIIYNNMTHASILDDIQMYALRLYNLDRAIDVNINSVKTPILILCDEKEKLSLLNLYKEYDGNAPVIFGKKNLDLNKIQSIQTNAPFISDQLYYMKQMIWNDALTMLGYLNTSFQKKEKMTKQEVLNNSGGSLANRNSPLEERKKAFRKINEIFKTDIEVNFNDQIDLENTMKVIGDKYEQVYNPS